MRQLALFPILAVVAALIAWPADKKKKNKKGEEQEVTQVLELPKEPPSVLVASADRLAFQVTPLFSKGLLSQQVRDGLKWLMRKDRGILHLRAFVAGTGDTRRVQTIVSEVFTEKRLPLPTLTVIQIGALPGEGAQVVLEATEAERKPVNPGGLAFAAARPFSADQPFQPVLPLFSKAVDHARAVLDKAGVPADGVLAATCYVTSFDDIGKLRQAAATHFPNAAIDIVQPLRGALNTSAACEAAGRVESAAGAPAQEGGAAVAGSARLAITGAQLAFGGAEADARLAFERLAKALEQVQAAPADAVVVHLYPLGRGIGSLARKVASGVFGEKNSRSISVVAFEGLPSIDASFSVDLIAVIPNK